MSVETLWKVWTELLDVLGLDVSNLSQYFSPASVSSSPARALLLVGVVLLAYWFLSLTLGFTFSVLHVVFGRFFWIVRSSCFPCPACTSCTSTRASRRTRCCRCASWWPSTS
uniref:Cervical cancer oncogene binding protein n=1 Tax=Homo sapiens TaxID=9606 RepID=Q8IX35_HUMAN|nr:cervical cancer oncogene binding protein [Homo sapiens]